MVIFHKDDLKKTVLAISVLITGATGLVGSRLTELLLAKGHTVSHLGRSKKSGNVPSFVWDVRKGEIDPTAFQGAQAIVHLAGASVGEKRWTPKRKREILESRTKSSALIYETLKKNPGEVTTVVSASAIGFYGNTLGNEVYSEEHRPGTDFLAGVVDAWEKEVERITSLAKRVVKLRIGIVLSEHEGALQQMAKPVRMFVGSPLASGNQIVSWIHVDDLCEMFIKAIEDQTMRGTYNAVAPRPVSNREMTKVIARILKRPLLLPSVPGFVLHVVWGEFADAVIKGSTISSEKIQKTGFKFKFPELEGALKDCLKG